MRDTGCGLRVAGCETQEGSALWDLARCSMAAFYARDESIQLSTDLIEQRSQRGESRLVLERARVPEFLEMIDRLVARRVGVGEKTNVLRLVTPPAVALDDVRPNRFRRASNLAASLVHLELWQIAQRHAVNLKRSFPSKLPDFQVTIVHAEKGIDMGWGTGLDLATRIAYPASRVAAYTSRIPNPASRITIT